MFVVCRISLLGLPLAAILLAAELHDGEGKKIVETACTSCHAIDVVTSKRMSKQEWQGVVNSMIDRGASLSKEDATAVVEYLARNFGKE